ncbi:MAG: ABC transporter ATP-binding protein [Treponema sp.]|nr:ABC transporter ATP-binding protein [Treponema sp.]
MPLLSMQNIEKFFSGKPANDRVCLELEAGEIHALLGENGAGKTTLMNILYGMYARDGGEIFYQGEAVNFDSPREAISRHIGMVHQHFTLVPTLTVSQNITLGLKSPGYPFPNRKRINRIVTDLSARYGLDVDPAAYVKDLSVGARQRVEIIKLLYRDAKLLILDEPTAVLTPRETDSLFGILHRLRDEGHGIIIITHRIAEVLGHTDRVTILRDGKNAAALSTAETTAAELSRYMIGRDLPELNRSPVPGGAVPGSRSGLRLSGVSLSEKNSPGLGPVSLSIPPACILGIAGVDGNGQKELAETIIGIRTHQSGSITLDGESLDGLSVLQRRNRGIAYISDDRHHDGLVLDMDLMDNLLLKTHRENRFLRHGLIDRRQVRAGTAALVDQYRIKASSLESPVRYLSGGNQQKLILAREMEGTPRLIIASQPARGLDIGASEFIHRQLLEHRNRGCSIMLLSTDLEEILLLSDLIAVIHHGKIMGLMEPSRADMTALGLMMAGVEAEEKAPGMEG